MTLPQAHDSEVGGAGHRPIVSFAPRGGRMNDVQRRAWDAHAGTWLVERPDVGGGIDQQALFGRIAPLVLEIGPGMGDATAAMALARPEVNLLAVEVYKPGIAQTFSNLARRAVTNVRVLRADAVEVLHTVVAPGSLAEVWLFFPDPWPKRKHVKRRIVTPEFAELVASRLQPGGSWWLATDWEPYARQMLQVVSHCPGLVNPHAADGGWAPRPAFRPETRFERRGLAQQRAIHDLHVVRAPAATPESTA
jgi:tRNA (guanine-N7-)-methyltransferase